MSSSFLSHCLVKGLFNLLVTNFPIVDAVVTIVVEEEVVEEIDL